MEQTLEYLSCGKFQYCNICFRRLKILYNSCFVCLWKKKHHVIWKCGSVAINLFVDVTALGMTVPFPPYIMPLEELLSSWMYGSLNSSYSLCSLTVAIDTALLPQLHPPCYRWNKQALIYSQMFCPILSVWCFAFLLVVTAQLSRCHSLLFICSAVSYTLF